MWQLMSDTLTISLSFKTYFIPLWITEKYKLMIVNRAEVSRNKFTSAQVLRKKQKSKNKLVCRIQVRRRESYQTNFNGTLWQIILQIRFWWGAKVYVQKRLEPSSGILHCYHLTRGSMLTSQFQWFMYQNQLEPSTLISLITVEGGQKLQNQ